MATKPLSETHPELCREWHPTLNGDLTPDKVSAGSQKKVWWVGECGHLFELTISKRTSRNSGCQYCSNRKLLTGFNDLGTRFPDVASEWHPTKNGDITPEHVFPKTPKIFWWLGKCGHEWESPVSSRSSGHNCPICSGNTLLLGFNDLASTNPQISQEWHPTKNGNLTAEMVSQSSGVKVWWLGECGHEWKATPGDRKSGYGCPYCSSRYVLSGFNDLKTKFPKIAIDWHPTKNGDLVPESVSPFSNKKVYWLGECGHEWQASIARRVSAVGCPYCSSSNAKTLSGFNDLATTNPQIASEWHPTKNGKLTPAHLSSGSNKKVWWLGKCGHEWVQTVNDRKNGASCPFCKGKAVLAGFNDLATTHPALAAEWHPTKNGDITPRDKSAGNKYSVFWLGKCGHEWKATINNRTAGSGCPTCSPGGFNASRSGVLYFIHNRDLHSFKVGISSKEAKNNRLSKFEGFGWEVVRIWENDSGTFILNTETRFLSWLRKTKGIPQFLDKQTIGLIRGETETFSDSILTKQEVIAKIEELLANEEQ